MDSFLQTVLALFIVINPIGNTPFILSVIKGFSTEKQHRILARELILAIFLAFFFLFVGKPFLTQLQVADYTISLCGGIVLFIVAMQMIFPKPHKTAESTSKQEPFLIPIATPILSGPVLLTTVMLKAHEMPRLTLSMAIGVSYLFVTIIVMLGPTFNRILGERGLIALEQLMGLLMTFIAIEAFLQGVQHFMDG